jgi:hypothetical protein
MRGGALCGPFNLPARKLAFAPVDFKSYGDVGAFSGRCRENGCSGARPKNFNELRDAARQDRERVRLIDEESKRSVDEMARTLAGGPPQRPDSSNASSNVWVETGRSRANRTDGPERETPAQRHCTA